MAVQAQLVVNAFDSILFEVKASKVKSTVATNDSKQILLSIKPPWLIFYSLA